ncbi:CDP-diacylglycerol-glycerol-3-phosphate 3-phosphatidyltransferase [Quillaja saponaria]|uniref:CDP-diacylglycerol-glycerol-3-phosphate 3-phosphatidyltransferase n=1 Tax=Quillaja saponaria TaxID=32244 RepID=A0AAD7PA64_QUISA|nr:CDP-diacylglycerol-glycerol-3-phosphate 3-phosphatidyltransferase [Quillaja saponaria]
MGSEAPNWADQWGSFGDDEDNGKLVNKKGSSSGGKKMADVKAVASAGLDKAKDAATVGADRAKTAAVASAQKVKSGTSAGFKWMKNQYQKKSSK